LGQVSKLATPLATALLFSGSYIGGKYAVAELGPLTTTLLRYLVALGFLSLLLPGVARGALAIERGHWWQISLLGLFGIVGYHYFFFLSLRYTEATNTALINALSPVVTGALAATLIGERLARRGYAGVVAASLGVLLLVTGADPAVVAGLDFNRGDLLMLLAVLSWTGYALLVKTLSQRYSGFALTYHATLVGVLALVPLVLLEGPLTTIPTLSPAAIAAVLYMGVCGSGLTGPCPCSSRPWGRCSWARRQAG
jgi:drug/metabolite transporter (DMT)-like permease